MATYISEVKSSVGEELVTKIFEEAERGKISTKQGELLASELGKKGQKVIGNFLRRKRSERNVIDGSEVEFILSDWWNDGAGCYEPNPRDTLMRALESAKLPVLLSKLKKLDVNSNILQGGEPEERNSTPVPDDGGELIGLVSLRPSSQSFRRANSVESQRECKLPRRWKKRWIIPLATAGLLLLGGFAAYEYVQIRYNPTSTRTIRIGGSKEPSKQVSEIHSCPSAQSPIPDLRTPLVGHVTLQINPSQTLVCGGTDRKNHDAKSCAIFTLGDDDWEDFPFSLNEVRINAHAKLSDNRVYIIGGESSHPTETCRNSQEVLQLESTTTQGWTLEDVSTNLGALMCFPPQTTVEIPCL